MQHTRDEVEIKSRVTANVLKITQSYDEVKPQGITEADDISAVSVQAFLSTTRIKSVTVSVLTLSFFYMCPYFNQS